MDTVWSLQAATICPWHLSPKPEADMYLMSSQRETGSDSQNPNRLDVTTLFGLGASMGGVLPAWVVEVSRGCPRCHFSMGASLFLPRLQSRASSWNINR